MIEKINLKNVEKIGIEFIENFKKRAEHGNNYSFIGRISSIRNHSRIIFIDLFDHTDNLQLIFDLTQFKENLSSLNIGSYIEVEGMYIIRENNSELKVNSLKILHDASLKLSPTPWEINGLDSKNVNQLFNFTEHYLANPQRMAILKIKTNFVHALTNYFLDNGFTSVEPPILTEKILYEEDNAIKAEVHGENVFLSQCATFELEPLATVFGKVFTISPAFRNEKGGSKRHLAEYSHAKAEVIFADTEDLISLAGYSIYSAVKKTIEVSKKELKLLGVKIDLESLHPENHVTMTYDDAFKVLVEEGSEIKYGEGLKKSDEMLLTKHVGNKYLWVRYLPFESEGFPYKRHPDNPKLSMTCDLIAPHGAGEMVGVAEKITDMEELLDNLTQKGKADDLRRYWKYALLRKYGMPKHGGIGAAPERIIYGLLGLNHIRLTKPWSRYPDRKINTNAQEKLNPWRDEDLERIIKKYNLI